MALLNSNFDVISRDPLKTALAGLVVVLDVQGASSPYSTLPASGTPAAGLIAAGSIVVMNQGGKAVLADTANTTSNPTVGGTAAPCLMFITVDGDQDYDGSFVHKLTCIQGGGEFKLDTANFVTDTYLPCDLLTCGESGGPTDTSGMFRIATTDEQIYGIVGSDGYDAVNDTLSIIIPQGICPAAA